MVALKLAVLWDLPPPGEPPGGAPGSCFFASMPALVTASGQHVWSGYADPWPRWSQGDDGGSTGARLHSGRGDGGVATVLPGCEVEEKKVAAEGQPIFSARASSTGNEEERVAAGEAPPSPSSASSVSGALLLFVRCVLRRETWQGGGGCRRGAACLLHQTLPGEAQMLEGFIGLPYGGARAKECFVRLPQEGA